MSLARRTLLIGAPLAAVVAVSGCSLLGGQLRRRLDDELTRIGFDKVPWVKESGTTVEVIETPLLTTWQVLHATNGNRQFIAAVPVEGEGVYVLTGQPGNWAEMLRAAGARIDVPASAEESARMLLLTTDDQLGRQTIIESVDDMPWVDRDAVDVMAVRNEFGHEIAAPVAERDGKRWTVIIWTTHERDLIRHAVGIEPDLLHATVDEVWVSELPLQVAS